MKRILEDAREESEPKRVRYAEFDFGSVFGPPQIIFHLLLECDAEKTCRALACTSWGWNAAWNRAWLDLIAAPLDRFYANIVAAVCAFHSELSLHTYLWNIGMFNFEWKLPDPTTMLQAYARRPTPSLCKWADRMWPSRPEPTVLFDMTRREAIRNFWEMFDPKKTIDRRRHYIPCFIADCARDECWPYYRVLLRLTGVLNDSVCDALFIQLIINAHDLLHGCGRLLTPTASTRLVSGPTKISVQDKSTNQIFSIFMTDPDHPTWFRIETCKSLE